MGYATYILLCAILFIRPEELLPALTGARLYLIAICVCTLANLERLKYVISAESLAKSPISNCVVGMLIAVPLSNAAQGAFDRAQDDAGEFGKVVLFYFLTLAVLSTKERFRNFLGCCVVLIGVLVVIAQLQFHDYIDIEHMEPVMQRVTDPETGEITFTPRICSTGVFNDPNDLCLVLVFGVLCCLYRAFTAAALPLRLLWLTPIAGFGYTLTLTQSRGGMLGLLAGMAGLLVARFGGRRAAPLVVIVLPGILLGVGGRQASIGLGKGDTANERVMLWAEGLSELLSRPRALPTGIGANEHALEFGLVAHNSYVHAFVELGLFGGTVFMAAFVWSALMLRRVKVGRTLFDPDLIKLRPFVIGMFAAYAAGIYSISRDYVIPTYLLLGLVASYLNLAMPNPPAEFQFSQQWIRRTAMIGLTGFVVLKLFTQFAGHMG